MSRQTYYDSTEKISAELVTKEWVFMVGSVCCYDHTESNVLGISLKPKRMNDWWWNPSSRTIQYNDLGLSLHTLYKITEDLRRTNGHQSTMDVIDDETECTNVRDRNANSNFPYCSDENHIGIIRYFRFRRLF